MTERCEIELFIETLAAVRDELTYECGTGECANIKVKMGMAETLTSKAILELEEALKLMEVSDG